MRKLIFATILLGSLLSLAACENNTLKNSKSAAEKKKAKYYCTMHPDETSAQPGLCAKCGMDLVERDTTQIK